MSQQLKVGQVWKNREGNEVELERNTGPHWIDTHPFRRKGWPTTYTKDGIYSADMVSENGRDLIELIHDVPDSDGWITWNGGECPVPDGHLVDVEYRDGERKFSLPANELVDMKGRDASSCFWYDEGSSNDIVAYRVVEQPAPNPKHAHYFKSVAHLETVDVYRVCELFGVTDQAIGHAIKKLLCAGQRGVKDQRKDVQEAVDTLTRRVSMWQEDEAAK